MKSPLVHHFTQLLCVTVKAHKISQSGRPSPHPHPAALWAPRDIPTEHVIFIPLARYQLCVLRKPHRHASNILIEWPQTTTWFLLPILGCFWTSELLLALPHAPFWPLGRIILFFPISKSQSSPSGSALSTASVRRRAHLT